MRSMAKEREAHDEEFCLSKYCMNASCYGLIIRLYRKSINELNNTYITQTIIYNYVIREHITFNYL